ncbi:replication protein A 70 kDa DNA-binding subunit-like isoform X3 [Stigmatopora nigra]
MLRKHSTSSCLETYISPCSMMFQSEIQCCRLCWTIRVRVTHNMEIHNWSNFNGEGKVFSFDKSGEIRITAYNCQVDTFFSLVEPNEDEEAFN